MKFSEKLIRLRKIKGITQDELASEVGVSRQAVYKWESGQSYPEVLKLIELKRLFEISIDDLLDENYEIALPDKKKRRRDKKKVEVSSEIKEESVASAGTVVEEISHAPSSDTASSIDIIKDAEEDEKIENVGDGDNTVTENDSPAPENKEEKEDKEPEAQQKRVGFFGRLFGRR